MTLQPYKTDVAVLILFFNRPDHLKKVFDEVRKARPSRLFLYQDGPRGERDMPGIEACRRVVENIDWQCEVHRKYCLLYTSPSPRDRQKSRMPSSA